MATTKKPQIRVNRYPNGYWVIIYGKVGMLGANKAECIAKLQEQYPGDYDVIDVVHERTEIPREVESKIEVSAK